MRNALVALPLVASLIAPAAAQVQSFPQTLPANTVVGRLGIGPGPSQAIPIATLLSTLGAAGRIGLGIKFISPLDKAYGALCNGSNNDTAAIVAALAAASGNVFYIPPGYTCVTDPVVISQTLANIPAAIIASGSSLKARAISANPLLTIENVQCCVVNFSITGLKLNANSLHATGLKIHGLQFGSFRDVEVTGGTARGIWLSGEPGYGIYYSNFTNVYSHANTGPGWELKSINNSGGYYIASNTFTNATAVSNTTYGYDIDYASGLFSGCEAELDTLGGVNLSHTIGVTFNSCHLEANGSPDKSFIGTANSTGVKVFGGRTIGTITASLLSEVTNVFLSGDASAAVIAYIGGVNFSSTGVSTPLATGLGIGGASAIADSINSGPNGIAMLVQGATKGLWVNGLRIGSPTGGDKGAGTINTAAGIYASGYRLDPPVASLAHAQFGGL